MIALKLEQVGDHVAVFLDEEIRAAYHLKIGDTVQLSRRADGVVVMYAASVSDGRHERGRAFLKRYQKSLGEFGP